MDGLEQNVSQNLTFKPGDPIPQGSTQSLIGAESNVLNTSLKPGDPILAGATSTKLETNNDALHLGDTLLIEDQITLGAIKGMGQTGHTLGRVANIAAQGVMKGMGIKGNIPWLPQDIKELDYLNLDTTGEKIGNVGESIAEFALGDEALKGLSVAERLGWAKKLNDIAKESPLLSKILSLGINSVQQGMVVTGQQIAHGDNLTDALKTGGEAGLFGLGTGALTEGLTQGAGKAGQFIKNLKNKATVDPQTLQPEFQQGIKDLVSQVADEEGVSKSKAASIRNYIGETADNIQKKAVDMLQKVDAAAGVNFIQKYEERIKNINMKLKMLTEALGGLEETKLEEQRQEIMDAMEQAYSRAEVLSLQGATVKEVLNAKQVVKEGLATFKKAQALNDIDRELNRTSVTKGLRPDLGTAAQTAANPENVKLTAFFDRIEQMYGTGRLQEALGEERAKNFLLHASDSVSAHAKLATETALAQKKLNTLTNLGKGAIKTAAGGGLALGAGSLIQSMREK